MTKVTLNIDKFTLIPMYWEFNNIREFTDFIRSEMFNILKYAQANFVSRSTLLLGIHIHEDCDDNNYFQWDFVISCKNIREFKPYDKMSREEFGELIIQRERNDKINEILK